MTDPQKDLHCQLRQELSKSLAHISESRLHEFKLCLFPCEHSFDVFDGILSNIALRLQKSNSKEAPTSEIAKEILQKSKVFGYLLEEALTRLFESGFLDRVKTKTTVINVDQNVRKNEKRRPGRPAGSDLAKRKNQKFQEIKQGQCKVMLSTQGNSLVQRVGNIDEGECNCQQLLPHFESGTFRCCHCGYLIHLSCVKKNENSPTNQCLACHLRHIIPNKPVKKQLFAGVLRKGSKRHELSFKIEDEDLKSYNNMQIRCFRIKETTNTFILFPDSAIIEINGNVIKEFVPLHKQSCLKYRKDEPITVDFTQLSSEMKVVITEEGTAKEKGKEERVQLENHLIAFYMVEDMQCSDLCSNIESTCLSSFQESFRLLGSAWKGENNIQEISLEMIKIPLLCALTTQRIKTPVRGIFCRHFQCFDLHSYVYIISQTANPRWVCPLCRLPAYQLRVDCILLAILTEHSQVEKLTEVLFFRSGEYSLANEKQVSESNKRSIHELSIEAMRKRQREEGREGCGRGRGRGREVISLL